MSTQRKPAQTITTRVVIELHSARPLPPNRVKLWLGPIQWNAVSLHDSPKHPGDTSSKLSGPDEDGWEYVHFDPALSLVVVTDEIAAMAALRDTLDAQLRELPDVMHCDACKKTSVQPVRDECGPGDRTELRCEHCSELLAVVGTIAY